MIEDQAVSGDRGDGYGQLIDEDDKSGEVEEETKLIDAEDIPDGASSSRMGESARVAS